jgi:hypothetical protein
VYVDAQQGVKRMRCLCCVGNEMFVARSLPCLLIVFK